MSSMDVEITNVAFKGKEAEATVSFKPKGADASMGMSMRYTLEQKGNEWVVKGREGGGMGGHGATKPAPNPNLPPDHPPLGSGMPPGAKKLKRVAVLGGGPAGAMTAERLATAGLDTVILDEKLAWEKPCGGGITYKAYREYPFLLENDTPKKIVRRSYLTEARVGAVGMELSQPLLIYSRKDLNGMMLNRAEKAGAQIEQTRVMGIERRNGGLVGGDQERTPGRGLPGGGDGGEESAAGGGNAVDGGRYDDCAWLLCAGGAGTHRHSFLPAIRRLYLGVPAMRAPVGGDLREGGVVAGAAGAARELHAGEGHSAEGRGVFRACDSGPGVGRIPQQPGGGARGGWPWAMRRGWWIR